MNDIIEPLEVDLKRQLSDLEDQIRTAEANLLMFKEGYLKVQGALEILAVMRDKQQQLDDDL